MAVIFDDYVSRDVLFEERWGKTHHLSICISNLLCTSGPEGWNALLVLSAWLMLSHCRALLFAWSNLPSNLSEIDIESLQSVVTVSEVLWGALVFSRPVLPGAVWIVAPQKMELARRSWNGLEISFQGSLSQVRLIILFGAEFRWRLSESCFLSLGFSINIELIRLGWSLFLLLSLRPCDEIRTLAWNAISSTGNVTELVTPRNVSVLVSYYS